MPACHTLPALPLLLFLSIALSACSSGGSSVEPAGTDTGNSTPTNTTTGGTTTGTSTNTTPTGTNTGSNATLPYSGVLTLDEIGWFLDRKYRGVIDIDLPGGNKERVFDGSFPRWHAGTGSTIYRQPCGDTVHRIVSGQAGTLPRLLTPCSSDVDNPGYSQTDFEQSALSPDGTLLAVEKNFWYDRASRWNTLVFDVETNSVLSEFDNHGEAMWLPDGNLLMINIDGGMSVGDPLLGTLTSFANGLYDGSYISNPALSPDGTLLAFELDQHIWLANVDGSDPRSVIFGDRRFRFPTWSPDGSTLAYLGVDGAPGEDHYDEMIYFTHLPTGQHNVLDMTPWLDLADSTTISGPITWH